MLLPSVCFVCLMFLLCLVLRAGFAKVTLDSGRSHLHHASWETWQHCAVLIINQFLTLLISWKLTSFHQTHFNRSGIASRSQDGWLSSGWTWNSGSAYLGSPPCWELAPTSHLQLGDQPSSPLISQHHHHNHHHQSSPSIINHHHLSTADDSAISLESRLSTQSQTQLSTPTRRPASSTKTNSVFLGRYQKIL